MKTKLLFGLSLLVILFSCTNDDSSMPGLADVRQIATTDVYVSVLDTNKTVNMDKAKYVAQLYREKNFSETVTKNAAAKEVSEVELVRNEEGEELFYIVNYANNQGFVLVSATQDYEPVLAYSEEGNFSMEHIEQSGSSLWIDEQKMVMQAIKAAPDSIRRKYRSAWFPYSVKQERLVQTRTYDDVMQMLTDSIERWRSEGYEIFRLCDLYNNLDDFPEQVIQEAYLAAQSAPHLYGGQHAVTFILRREFADHEELAPLLQTKWNQTGGYAEFTDNHYPVGCVAVAMGQIMKYYEYPIAYDWDAMADLWPTSVTASFLSEIGGSVHMEYGADGSGAYIEDAVDAFRNIYGYSLAARGSGIASFSARKELKKYHPVYMQGFGYQYTASTGQRQYAGHAWVCDGYRRDESGIEYAVYILQGNDPNSEPTEITYIYTYKEGGDYNIVSYYHMNWGWGGANNGYFYEYVNNMEALEFTDSYGNHYDFSNRRESIVNLYPYQ